MPPVNKIERRSQPEQNTGFEHFVSQVFSQTKPELLKVSKEELEDALVRLKDKIIGNHRYDRGSALKRWGFTIRKYITTPLGRLKGVRIPRSIGSNGVS